jgi:lipid II:glycine glycyltransferase (peptidoglycan interpeptide bridge formation enzyme)
LSPEREVRVQPAGLEVLAVNQGLLQSPFWARFRAELGWEAKAFDCRAGAQGFALLVLVRSLPLGQRLAYVPHGPEIAAPEDWQNFLRGLTRALRPHLEGCLFLRFDLPWSIRGDGTAGRPPASGRRLRRAPMDIQPPSTVILDLGHAEEALLAAMKSKTRYNIGLARKKGVVVEEGSAGDLPAWYELYRETARRDRITLHPFDYYRRQFELAAAPGGPVSLKLLLARHQGELLAGIIVALMGQAAWYLYGASSDRKRNLMPAYALQWEAMRMARRAGCLSYDLFGIPPADDPAHPMHGLYRFKTGFGGRLLHRLGCWDAPFRPAGYQAYRLAERGREWYYRRLRKKLGA